MLTVQGVCGVSPENSEHRRHRIELNQLLFGSVQSCEQALRYDKRPR